MYNDMEELRREFPDPLWYFMAERHRKYLSQVREKSKEEYEVLKEKYYDLFEEALLRGEIHLGHEKRLWDKGRWKMPDTIVLHHTSMSPGLSPERLSAIELFRLFVPTYANPKPGTETRLTQGEPISSGHIRLRKKIQVFWPYHWLIREDGTPVRLLYDYEVGWHAGFWQMNYRSYGVCFDGDFEHGSPNIDQFRTVRWLRKRQYPHIATTNIIGHNEVKPERKLECPSPLFLSDPTTGRRGWKEEMLEVVR